MKIALTGGTGFIGSHLAETLTAAGHDVTCLVRQTSNLRWLQDLDVRTVAGDLDDPGTLNDLVGPADTVVHTSGAKFAYSLAEFLRGNLSQTKNIYDAIARSGSGVARFLYISSISAAGPSATGAPLTEDMPLRPITPYGVSKAETERFVASHASRVPFTIIRPPGVYGPRDKDLLIYFRLVRHHLKPILGRMNRFDFVYVKNLCHGIRLAIESERASNETYYLSDAVPYTWRSFTQLVCEAIGTSAMPVRPPIGLSLVVAEVAARMAKALNLPVKLDKHKIREFIQRFWVVSTRKAQEELGYLPSHDAQTAVSATARWYRANGWIK